MDNLDWSVLWGLALIVLMYFGIERKLTAILNCLRKIESLAEKRTYPDIFLKDD